MTSLILSCEHATARIPSSFSRAFSSSKAQAALASHRGVDLGAATIARFLARRTGARCVYGSVSRLLVDLNRSANHPARLSEYSRILSASEREQLQRIRDLHEEEVEALVGATPGRVLHVAVHTFAPRLAGRVRAFDVGVLYDPSRSRELVWAREFQRRLADGGALRVRRNAPYRGISDGLPTTMRKRWGPNKYLGIELEINQALAWPAAPPAFLEALLGALVV